MTLDWVLRLMQHAVESDPDQVFIVDVVPNLRWLVRNEFLMKESCEELAAFEEKVTCQRVLRVRSTLYCWDQNTVVT